MKYYKMWANTCREFNKSILEYATKFRIIPFQNDDENLHGYILEAYVQTAVTPGEWKPVKCTYVPFVKGKHPNFEHYEFAYNRCKKLALKIGHISMNKLINESWYSAYCYESEYNPKYTNKEINYQ